MNEKLFFLLFKFANKSQFNRRIVIILSKFMYYLFFIMYLLCFLYLIINFKQFGFISIFKYIFIPFLAFITTKLIRTIFKSKRPFEKLNINSLIKHKNGNSFPSNHSTSAMVLAMTFSWLFPKFFLIFISLAIFTSLLRVMVGVHYPVDILAGLIIGFIIGFIFFK